MSFAEPGATAFFPPPQPYFEGLAEIAATGGRPDDTVMAEFYRRHDTYWV